MRVTNTGPKVIITRSGSGTSRRVWKREDEPRFYASAQDAHTRLRTLVAERVEQAQNELRFWEDEFAAVEKTPPEVG